MLQPFFPSLESHGELSLIYIGGESDFRVQAIWGGTMTPADPEAHEGEIGARTLPANQAPLLRPRRPVTDTEGDPKLIELELIEPNLYLSTHPTAANDLAEAVLETLSQEGRIPL